MTKLIRWLLLLAGVLAATVALAPPGAAAPPVLDGVQMRHLPAGLGASTDFSYSYDDVDFAARVWESGSDAAGWRVDLDVEVLRGARLTDVQALHDWFIAYEERPPGEAQYRPVRVHGLPGWACRDQVFWLVRPGMAISVLVDGSRWSHGEVMRTARGARLVS